MCRHSDVFSDVSGYSESQIITDAKYIYLLGLDEWAFLSLTVGRGHSQPPKRRVLNVTFVR